MSEHSWGTFFTVRPVPKPGTPVSIISGEWKGYTGTYKGTVETDSGNRHKVSLDNARVSEIFFEDPSIMQYDSVKYPS